MAYDDDLAIRLLKQLEGQPGIIEKKMFGGLSFLLNGNMCCGVHGQEMIVRINPKQTDQTLSQPHTRIFDLTGKPMQGWILVQPDGLTKESDLATWVQLGVEFASSLPSK